MAATLIGYTRYSNDDQGLTAQRNTLISLGCHRDGSRSTTV